MSGSTYFSGWTEFFVAAENIAAAVTALHTAAPKARVVGFDAVLVVGFDAVLNEEILELPQDLDPQEEFFAERMADLPEHLEPREALIRIFGFYGWRVSVDKDGSITEVYLPRAEVEDHVADTPDLLFDGLAPYVREGSHVRMVSSDGAAWAYHFRGGACHQRELMDTLNPRAPGVVSSGQPWSLGSHPRLSACQ